MPWLKNFFTRIWRWLREHWKLVSVVLVVLLIGAFIFYRRSRAAEAEIQTFVTPTRQTLNKTVEVSGVVDAKEKATLRFAAGGRLTYLNAKEGDVVKRNQTLARIDARELQKRLQQDLNLYFNERMDFEQAQDTRENQAITTTDERVAQKDQKTLENSVLDVEIRDIAIRNTTLSAPFDGQLVAVPATAPNVFLGATEGFELISPASLYFKAAVDEVDISSITKGQLADIHLDAYPEETLTASVSAIAYRSAQGPSGTVFLVDLPMPQATGSAMSKYRLGMNGDVAIITATRPDVLSIPLDTTREREGKTFVTVKTGEKTTEEREITVGLQTDEWVEVTGGLTETDQILVPS
jgi:RND family efflux transporter MFP subunit